jgi:hypothetical protein
MSGKGIKGAEGERLKDATDPRIKKRVYFYIPVEGGIPQPEICLGGAVYTADLDGLYDFRTAEKPITGDGNDFESAILDAGYRGYIAPEQGTIVILNEDVEVKSIGSIGDHNLVQRRAERVIPKIDTRAEGNELVRKPQGSEMIQLASQAKHRKIRETAPSFMMEYGFFRVKQSEATAADAAIAEFSPTFRFELQRSARDVDPSERRRKNVDALRRMVRCLS